MLDGFVTAGAIIGLGLLLAHIGVFDAAGVEFLSKLSMLVASPALMIVLLGRTDLGPVFSGALAATATGVGLAFAFYLLVAGTAWRRSSVSQVIGGLSAVHVNSGTLGIPIAVYVLDDASMVLPMLIVQLLIIQPVALVLIDHVSDHHAGGHPMRAVRRSLLHPLMIATGLGLGLSFTHTRLPGSLEEAIALVGAMAVPAMLLGYGASLRFGQRLGQGASASDLGLVVVTKLCVHPAATYVLARHVFGVEGTMLVGVTVMAALPSAQNVFILASHYKQGVDMARDALLATTVLAIPTLLMVSALIS